MSRALLLVVVFLLPCEAVCQTDDGWRPAGFSGNYTTMFSQTEGSVIAAIADDPMFRDTLQYLSMSFDNGVTWPVHYQPTNLRITAVALWRGIVYAGTFKGLYFSADSGRHWMKGLIPGNYVRSLAVSKSMLIGVVDTLICVTGDRWIEYWGIAAQGAKIPARSHLATKGDTVYWSSAAGVMISTDNGSDWTRVDSTHIFEKFAPANSWLFAADLAGNVLRSSDAGRTWQQLSPDAFAPYTIAAWHDYLFVSEIGEESTRTLVSSDGGVSWALTNPSGQPHRLYDLTVSGPNLLASSWNVGTWYKPISEIISSLAVGTGDALSESMSIYPEPSRSRVTLHITLASEDRPQLTITDITGRGVYRQDCGALTTGEHDITLSPDLPAGVYSVLLTTRSGSLHRMIQVVK
jgi:hypothetical protein